MLIRALPTGVKLLDVPPHADARGTLQAVEESGPIPFPPVRMFAIRSVPPGQWRARHAVSCHEFLWMMVGSSALALDDGTTRTTLPIDAEGPGVLVSSGVWMELSAFSADAILCVFASAPYGATKYFQAPRPELITRFA
jgi:UDP-2-acetamido-3-amino-2,3-dideoxy-glucuronate N-acetyltransferase